MSIVTTVKSNIARNFKNSIGWRTNRKIVVFGVDDYGNVRVDSKAARERMDKKGLKIYSRYDQYDALENEEDLLMLYEALSSVKDKNGNPAVFTALSIPANINFEKMKENGYEEYFYELLPTTFSKLKGYEKVWKLWKEGIDKKLIFPQFHGREHLNLKLFKENLAKKDKTTLVALENRSYTSIPSTYKTISPMAAFDFDQFEENEDLKGIIEDGLNVFEKVFGFRSLHFNPPGGREHHVLHDVMASSGIKSLVMPFIQKEYQGNGKYKTMFNYLGKRNKHNQIYIVRNCVFEPAVPDGIDSIGLCMDQIENAFNWKRPAIISSHRVNFCGHIDPENRKKGITDLRTLVQRISKKWPDVEFMTTTDLAELMNDPKQN